ncbi:MULTISPECIES: serine hydrolase domain-containing protein [Legionella]|uniref:serine hydrolase domain-containing protein n=1 Tax=Legionella TaxID=445 RepID=UPI000A9FE5DB|nr:MULTISPECIES: serine hydrolase domain-containing protein [Legionella]MBN9226629.1 beta-lactamase family protein [Legionella steelei]
MRLYRLFILFLGCISCVYAFDAASNTSLRNDIQQILDKNRKKYGLPGISLSIQFPNNKIGDYVSGYETLLKNKEMTNDTLFQMGSITKTFTATIIYKLVEVNKLNINDKVGKWLTQYPRWKKITLGDLLRHTSGVYNYTSGSSFDKLLRKNPQKYWSLKELADMAYQHHDVSIPGKKYHYTNTDYVLLGLIIEKVTHKPIHVVFDEYFKRYNLPNTFYSVSPYSESIKTRLAHGYNRDGTFKFNSDVTNITPSFAQSAGALVSTPHDLLLWLNQLFTNNILSKKSLENMTSLISTVNTKTVNIETIGTPKYFEESKPFTEIGIGAGIGLIYFKSNGMTWVHSGGTLGYESLYAYSPCNGIYLALAYNVKPRQQLIFIKIADELFKKLSHSKKIVKMVKMYQYNHLLPAYCHVLRNN